MGEKMNADTKEMQEIGKDLSSKLESIQSSIEAVQKAAVAARKAKKTANDCDGVELTDLAYNEKKGGLSAGTIIHYKYYADIKSTGGDKAETAMADAVGAQNIGPSGKQGAAINSLSEIKLITNFLDKELPEVVNCINQNIDEVETSLAQLEMGNSKDETNPDENADDNYEYDAGDYGGPGGGSRHTTSSTANFRKTSKGAGKSNSNTSTNSTNSSTSNTTTNKTTTTNNTSSNTSNNISFSNTTSNTTTTNKVTTTEETNNPVPSNPVPTQEVDSDNPTPTATITTEPNFIENANTTNTVESTPVVEETSTPSEETGTLATSIIGNTKDFVKKPDSANTLGGSSSSSGTKVIPVTAGLATATAAGIGTKAILDAKQSKAEFNTSQWTGNIKTDVDYEDGIKKQETLDDDDQEEQTQQTQ